MLGTLEATYEYNEYAAEASHLYVYRERLFVPLFAAGLSGRLFAPDAQTRARLKKGSSGNSGNSGNGSKSGNSGNSGSSGNSKSRAVAGRGDVGLEPYWRQNEETMDRLVHRLLPEFASPSAASGGLVHAASSEELRDFGYSRMDAGRTAEERGSGSGKGDGGDDGGDGDGGDDGVDDGEGVGEGGEGRGGAVALTVAAGVAAVAVLLGAGYLRLSR